MAQALDVPAHVELAFEAGTPIAVNGITMSLQELSEILTTIAGDHGFSPRSELRVASHAVADVMLAQAREALGAIADQPGTGVVRMKLHRGERTIVSVSPSSLAPHS